jgi:hypothetical protein
VRPSGEGWLDSQPPSGCSAISSERMWTRAIQAPGLWGSRRRSRSPANRSASASSRRSKAVVSGRKIAGVGPSLAPRFEMAELHVAQLVRQDGAEHVGREAAKRFLCYADCETGGTGRRRELRCR